MNQKIAKEPLPRILFAVIATIAMWSCHIVPLHGIVTDKSTKK